MTNILIGFALYLSPSVLIGLWMLADSWLADRGWE